jgi:hypothetical protein
MPHPLPLLRETVVKFVETRETELLGETLTAAASVNDIDEKEDESMDN